METRCGTGHEGRAGHEGGRGRKVGLGMKAVRGMKAERCSYTRAAPTHNQAPQPAVSRAEADVADIGACSSNERWREMRERGISASIRSAWCPV